MTLTVHTAQRDYDITIERGVLQRIGDWFDLSRKVLIVTDSGVPHQYVMTVASQCKEVTIFAFEQGESSKNLDTYRGILETLTANGFTRTDCVVAVGGGVVGDMAGFAAATYMRGIDFYNVPTTMLSQVDSSVGGKTAVDFMGYKNLVGAFYQPMGVVIDPDVLRTLSPRHLHNGLAESVKMGLTHDPILFELLENGELTDAVLDEVICRSIAVKKNVVEADEYESDQRKSLNFGHTWGHAVEATTGLLHGECVAEGMLPMCSPEVRARLITVLDKLELSSPMKKVRNRAFLIAALEACGHDKKASHDKITIVTVPKVGSYQLEKITLSECRERIMGWYR